MTELEKKLTELLNKHGICVDCGEMYCHHIDEPFASCKCGTSEWSKFTPYMELELALSTLRAENAALITDLKKVVTEATLADQEIATTVSHITTEQMVDKVKLKVDNHVKLVAAKSWSNLEDTKVVQRLKRLMACYVVAVRCLVTSSKTRTHARLFKNMRTSSSLSAAIQNVSNPSHLRP